MTLRLLDTFSGIGGFSYAAEHLVGGYETVQFIEIEPFCQSVLRKHWPSVPIHDDIKTFFPEPYSADVICGGFPCQDISNAGKRAGILHDTRSGLFYELMRVIRVVRPRYVILENVSAIVNRGLDTVLQEMAQAGYDAEWACIRASDVGACHQRNRWWLVAYANEIRPSGSLLPLPSLRRSDQRGKAELGTGKALRAQRWGQGPTRGEPLNPDWRSYVSEPVLRRGDDGLSSRVHRLKALGNSVVPQVAAIPLQRVIDIHISRGHLRQHATV